MSHLTPEKREYLKNLQLEWKDFSQEIKDNLDDIFLLWDESFESWRIQQEVLECIDFDIIDFDEEANATPESIFAKLKSGHSCFKNLVETLDLEFENL